MVQQCFQPYSFDADRFQGRVVNRMNRRLRIGMIVALVVTMPGMAFWLTNPPAAESVNQSLRLNSASDLIRSIPGEENGADLDSDIAEPPSSNSVAIAPAITYSVDQVKRWAYDRSPEAGLIESEITAVMRMIDPKDADACCSARLIRDVLTQVALGRRSDDATHAATAYHKLVAATQSLITIDRAIASQDRLIEIAEEAERLELDDGDALQVRQSRLDLLDVKSQQRFNCLRLRQELSRLTGRDESEVASASMIDPLPIGVPTLNAGEAVQIALAHRHDLQAVRVLCRELKTCNLDAVRMLMGIVSPGVGLKLAVAVKGLFSCLKEDRSDNDLQQRRRQCQQLAGSLEIVIRNETLQAVLDVRAAAARLDLIDQQIDIARQRLSQTRGAMRLDESAPGSDLLIELKIDDLDGKRIGYQKDLALAIENLDHACGLPVSH